MKIFFVWFLAFFLPVAAHAVDPAIFASVDSQIVCLKTVTQSGSELFGTGFLLDNETVATVSHQVVDAKEIAAYLGDQWGPALILADKPEWDVAVLRVPPTPFTGLKLNLSLPALGDEVFTIGCPMGLGRTLSKGGFISQPDREVEKMHLIQMEKLLIHHGNSGGPLVNAKGEVVGLIKGSWKGDSGLDFSIPVSYLSIVLKEVRKSQGSNGGASPSSGQAQATLDKGNTLLQQGQLEPALAVFEQLTRENPTFHPGFAAKGLALFKLGRHKDAEQALIKAISIKPDFAVAFLNLGMVYAEGLGKLDAAKQAFLRNLELDPSGVQAAEVQKRLQALQ